MGLLNRKQTSDPEKKVSRDITILNRLGLHARPSAMFVKICSRYKGDIYVEKDGEEVNGKSIMGLMMLAAGQGSKLRVTCTGHDADKAIHEIEGLVERRFDEE